MHKFRSTCITRLHPGSRPAEELAALDLKGTNGINKGERKRKWKRRKEREWMGLNKDGTTRGEDQKKGTEGKRKPEAGATTAISTVVDEIIKVD